VSLEDGAQLEDPARAGRRATGSCKTTERGHGARACPHGRARNPRRYVSSRRDRVDTFIDRHFTLSGSLALHRCSLGWDFVRSPLNLFLTDLIAATTGGVVIVGAALTAFSGVLTDPLQRRLGLHRRQLLRLLGELERLLCDEGTGASRCGTITLFG
jgi:hypothetical protein